MFFYINWILFVNAKLRNILLYKIVKKFHVYYLVRFKNQVVKNDYYIAKKNSLTNTASLIIRIMGFIEINSGLIYKS